MAAVGASLCTNRCESVNGIGANSWWELMSRMPIVGSIKQLGRKGLRHANAAVRRLMADALDPHASPRPTR